MVSCLGRAGGATAGGGRYLEEVGETAGLRERVRGWHSKGTCIFVGTMFWMMRELLWYVCGHLPLFSPWVGWNQ